MQGIGLSRFLALVVYLLTIVEGFHGTALQRGSFLARPIQRGAFLTRSSTTKLGFKTFDEMLTELQQPVLVDFYAEWCGPCKMMKPVLEEIAGRMEADIKVAKVDTDRSPTLGNRYNIEALPTLVLFYKGQPVDRYVGYLNADELEKQVRQSLKRIANQ
jgi:thioredoxin